MNYSRKKIALLMGALIIGQALTMQNAYGMEYDQDKEDNPEGYALYYPSTEENLINEPTNLYNNLTNWYAQNIKSEKTWGQWAFTPVEFITVHGTAAALNGVSTAINNTATNPTGQTLNNIGNALANSTGTGLETLANNIENLWTNNGAGSRATNNIANAFANGAGTGLEKLANNIENLWTNNGAGSRAANQFFNAMENQVGDDGAATQAMNQLFNTMEQQASDGGAMHGATRAAAENLGQFPDIIGSAINKQLGYGVGILVAGAAGYYTCSYGLKVLWNHIERQLQKPRVIINSSNKKSYYQRFKDYVLGKVETFPKMIYAPELEEQLDDTIRATRTISQHIKDGKTNVTYRNLLLWGPPGTGKTMFARQLAKKSGLEWVEVTGSSFFQENAGIGAIDELFEWANKSSKGLLIFIDEADSLLPDRTKMSADSENYKIVNHFLNHIGTKSNKFMVVMSTNHKIVFDAAMCRRIHDNIELPLPKERERELVLTLYVETILFDTKQNSATFAESATECFTPEKIKEVAKKTNGFSNDELATIIETVKSFADISDDGLISTQIIDKAVAQQIKGRQGFVVAQTA